MRADSQSGPAAGAPVRVVIVTLDGHLGGTVGRARARLAAELPGLELEMHPASDWAADARALEACTAAIARADIVVATMLFMEEHIQKVLPALEARAPDCDAMVCAMSAPEVVKLTRMGKLTMGGELKGPMALLKKLRGNAGKGGAGKRQSSGAAQMRTLRRLPKILKYVPGTAQDLRIYFIALQCWLAGSEENVACLVRTLVQRYARGPRAAVARELVESEPAAYPETGLYHPRLAGATSGAAGRVTERLGALPARGDARGRVGLLMLRSYVLAENTRHYDAVIEALEARGLDVVPAFSSGLDARPAIDAFFRAPDGSARIDALVSLTGFSLVGGPAYNDSAAAVEALGTLDVPYLGACPSEFQTGEAWHASERGLTPIETTMMVALPELDGATNAIVYGAERASAEGGAAPAPHGTGGPHGAGAATAAARGSGQDKHPIPERVARLAARTARLVALRRTERAERRLGIVLFNFPPNAGAVGTAAHLAVFESLQNTLHRLAAEGYAVEVPESAETLRAMLLGGNAGALGTEANVLATVPTDDHVRNTPWLEAIEAQWGPAPGRLLTDGTGIHVLGVRLGNVTVALQPGFGIEGDPMRLLFEGGFAPTHAFSAFYRYLAGTAKVDALLHFGTHGALEFMPGKQSGLSGDCWPERLIGDVPNVYLYASNNPSEATIAKRRSAATLVSYLTPTVTEAGLYRGLAEARDAIRHWHALGRRDTAEAAETVAALRASCEALELGGDLDWRAGALEATIGALGTLLHEYEHELVPSGMHVVGEAPTLDQRADALHAHAAATAGEGPVPARDAVLALLEERDRAGASGSAPATGADPHGAPAPVDASWAAELLEMDAHLTSDAELAGLVAALDARYVAPAPGGDLLRDRAVLPAGRNVHGFDPFRMPSAAAQRAGSAQAERLLERHVADTGALPRSVAFVLWGSDNMKSEGAGVAQALALMGARARVDAYGKVSGAELVPLAELGRPRIDAMVTLSGVFRDLLPLQIKTLAEAALLAATADEPVESNFVRRHALAHAEALGVDLETAALRVFGNADGAYGANVNHLIDSGAWSEEDELAETYANRKCYAFGTDGRARREPALLDTLLGDVDLAYQNLESVELGVTELDYYFDTLGGINSMVRRARGTGIPTYIGDQTRSGPGAAGAVRTLDEQVALETRTRMLNPKWYEGQLRHGYEGVRAIEATITNTLGWSATTGQVSSWVYNQVAQTFVLDAEMRERLATLNPTASARLAQRLIEASERDYWSPDAETLDALRDAGDELEDRLEGVFDGVAA